ncbi:MAG TPA: hypothetical protein VNO43_16995 [Candidatus Eisenbacteria bacterium]|nr:hypothetical protein [Candidatus Eisenbacteria bacterium]
MRLQRFVILLLAVLPLALGGAALLALSARPEIDRAAEIAPEDIEHAREILADNDPRKLKAGTIRTVHINEQDLDLAVNYLARQYANGGARVTLSDTTLAVHASLEVPGAPFGRYVNIAAIVRENGAVPRFERLRIGQLPLPGPLGDALVRAGLAFYLGIDGYRSALQAVKEVRFDGDALALTYEWDPDLTDTVRAALLPRKEQERIYAYQMRLVEISRQMRTKEVSLVDLLVPLFSLADDRSRGAEAVAENRAAILVLTLYVNQKGLSRFVPAAREWPRPDARRVTLNGRSDFAQHFTVSAALAANAGGVLSDAVGLYKEIADAREGSGFSFNDIAADRAGTRFGELAASSETALQLQKRLSAGVTERDLMPETRDLPEFMPEAEFRRRFGGLEGAKYRQMIAEIERRVAGLNLYR